VSAPIQPGSHKFGPDNATLRVRTARQGAAAKAGHDLVIEVTAWSATLEVGDDSAPTSLELDADAGSLRVREGTGGVQRLGDDDKADIEKTIDDEVLHRKPIEFRATAIEPAERGRATVTGDLKLAGAVHPVEFRLDVDTAGGIAATAVVKQSDWAIKPYSGLFGALKVKDEVEVEFSTG
jgi:polyisoprenoid-binding protein YceI